MRPGTGRIAAAPRTELNRRMSEPQRGLEHVPRHAIASRLPSRDGWACRNGFLPWTHAGVQRHPDGGSEGGQGMPAALL